MDGQIFTEGCLSPAIDAVGYTAQTAYFYLRPRCSTRKTVLLGSKLSRSVLLIGLFGNCSNPACTRHFWTSLSHVSLSSLSFAGVQFLRSNMLKTQSLMLLLVSVCSGWIGTAARASAPSVVALYRLRQLFSWLFSCPYFRHFAGVSGVQSRLRSFLVDRFYPPRCSIEAANRRFGLEPPRASSHRVSPNSQNCHFALRSAPFASGPPKTSLNARI